MEKNFENGVAIVTGGSGGIGREVCLQLARQGSDVFLTYNSRREPAEAVVAEIRALGRRADLAQVDLANAESTESFCRQAVDKYGRVHSVVYASGPVLHAQFLSEVSPADWVKVVNADVVGSFNLIRASLPHLKAGGGGAMVGVITAAVERVPAKDICSAAPKAAVEMLFRGVAKEEGRNKIRANCVAPGWIDVGVGREMMQHELTPQQQQTVLRSIPLRRLGAASEIADAVLFLLSSKAAFITGQSLAVDGGLQL